MTPLIPTFERPTQFAAALAAVVVLLAATGAPVATAAASTGSTASATNAGALAGSASFQPTVVYEERGDVANITVQTSGAATVNLGSPKQGFWLQVRVGGGTTTLRLNTYKAGQAGRYDLSEMVWASQGSIQSRTLRTAAIDAPLETAEYGMNVTVDGSERALGTLVVEERATNDISARIAPKSLKIEELTTADAIADATQKPWNGSVARGDWLVLRVDASGIGGVLEKSRLDGDGDHISVRFEQANPPMNGRSNDFYGDDAARLVRDGTSDGFYLFVDTGDHDIEPGDRYNVSFVVGKRSPLVNEREAVQTSIRIAPRKVEIDRLGPGQEIVVDGKTTISGSTTLTPGTTINVTVRNASLPPLFETATMTVKSDRTFGATFDFSGQEPGRAFEIRLPDQGKRLIGVVAGAETTAETTTPATTEVTETTAPTTTSASETTPTTVSTTSPTPGTTEGITQVAAGATESPLTERALRDAGETEQGGNSPVPGFGVELAIVALAGALLLARRAPGR